MRIEFKTHIQSRKSTERTSKGKIVRQRYVIEIPQNLVREYMDIIEKVRRLDIPIKVIIEIPDILQTVS